MVEKPVVREVVRPCITEPPPELPPVPAPTVCAPGMVCFRSEDGATLADNVERLQQRISNDYARCGDS